MSELSRDLSVFADGEPVTGFAHAQLSGRDFVGLYPMPFTLRLWNLSDRVRGLLFSSRELSVLHDGSVLAAGTITDICCGTVREGKITEVVFSPGIRLWEAPVTLSVESGVSVSETVRRLLTASGTGVSLLAFSGEDPVRVRGQAFCGRTAECIEKVLFAVGARGCLMPSGLCVIPYSGLPETMALTEVDLIDAPVRTGDKLMLLRTRVTGWPLGKTVSVRWKDDTVTGVVIGRSVDVDNMEGNWLSELLVEVRT